MPGHAHLGGLYADGPAWTQDEYSSCFPDLSPSSPYDLLVILASYIDCYSIRVKKEFFNTNDKLRKVE